MEQWDFLLQKEGDRSWLPLDSPDVEILEGRYRVVARSNQVNTEVNVAISHVTVDEDPPKRRSKRRAGRTNANGLMVILPYTYLRAGIWQIICTSTDVMADLLGADWRRSVRLQVLASLGIEEENHPIAPPVDCLTVSADLALSPETATPQEDGAIAPILPVLTPLTSQTIAPDLDDDVAEVDATGLPELPALPTPEIASPPEAISTNDAVVAGAMPSLDDLASLNLEIAQVLGLSMDRLLEMTEQLSHQVVEEALRGLNLIELANSWRQSTEAASEEFGLLGRDTVEVLSPEPAIAAEPASPVGESGFIPIEALQLELEHETLTACHGEALIISGWIELNPAAEPIHPAQPFPDWLQTLTELEVEDESVPLAEAKVQELRLYLRDPQTSQVLWSDRQPVPAITARFPFSFNMVVPRDLTTHLLVGEVLLCGLLPDSSEDESVVLKSQPFSVTVDPEQLMAEWAKVNQTLANHTDTEDMLDLPVQLSVELAASQQRSLLDLSFLKLAKTPDPELDPEPAVPASSATIGNSILPPQLYRPDPEQSGKKPLELPTFMAVAPAEPEAELTAELTNLESSVATEVESAAESLVPTNIDEALVNEALADEFTDELEQKTIVQEPDTCSVRELDLDIIPEVVAAPLSPVQTAFQALNLQERFFDRLNALASDADLKVSLQGAANGRTPTSHQSTAATMVSTDFAASEFVVDDDPEFDHWRQRRSTVLTRQVVAEEPEQPNPLLLPADEPVPVPTLEILADELVAGATVNIRVTLPNVLPRIYVKLWVNDRQTRSLLAGPQWLTDFFPNGFDALEAIVPLTVPMGSVEVRIEAIAVEIQTQRESRKVGLDQAVILDDFPLVSLDEFDF
ncbi:hypothetical protein [Pantanalinema sp. GBBB05]|uniref:hypothetical protein n=1 Tax=Pantanalinema sp. GBBB05 TaxID=2604139 RepID=UPI001D585BCA|nr:hypothetical protein [Pantanalinema sp. GBBB05]